MCDRAHETYYHRLVVLSNDDSMEIAPPDAVARVNLCELWVGCPLSLLGGKRPIATIRCDRRRAIINSCASRKALNSPGPLARIPPSLVARLRADVQSRIVTILG